MIEDRETWACANLLLKQHGAHARQVATRRADELLRTGDSEGYRTFTRIVSRIEALETMRNDGALH